MIFMNVISMKKIFIIFLFISNPLLSQTIKPLNTHTVVGLLEDDNSTYLVIEGCTSLYSAITELTKKRYHDLASEFYKKANILYPYGIITLSKIKSIPYEEAEKIYFNSTSSLTQEYIDEMNRNGEITGSFIKDSFLSADLFFCNEITSYLQLVVLESLEK